MPRSIVKPDRVTAGDPPYMSPKEVALMLRCSRASVDRLARRAGWTRVVIGEGRNGMVRFLREEVLAFIQARTIASN